MLMLKPCCLSPGLAQLRGVFSPSLPDKLLAGVAHARPPCTVPTSSTSELDCRRGGTLLTGSGAWLTSVKGAEKHREPSVALLPAVKIAEGPASRDACCGSIAPEAGTDVTIGFLLLTPLAFEAPTACAPSGGNHVALVPLFCCQSAEAVLLMADRGLS